MLDGVGSVLFYDKMICMSDQQDSQRLYSKKREE